MAGVVKRWVRDDLNTAILFVTPEQVALSKRLMSRLESVHETWQFSGICTDEALFVRVLLLSLNSLLIYFWMAQYVIALLERLSDNGEYTDCKAHKLYNNLGLAYGAKQDFPSSLKARREEKNTCKWLLSLHQDDTTQNLDVAIAYLRCGDAMIKLDSLFDHYNRPFAARDNIIHIAKWQHQKGFNIAHSPPVNAQTRPAVRLEMRVASAALALAKLALTLQANEDAYFSDAADP